MKNANDGATPLACDMSALTSEQRQRHEEASLAVLDRMEGVEETRSGYALRLPRDPSLVRDAAEFAALESICCPFLDLSVQVEREHGPVWLSMEGGEGVKDYLRTELVAGLGLEQ